MLDDSTRIEIAKSLDDLAAQDVWNADVWQRCYDLVGANMTLDDLVAYVHDDLIHYTGTPLFRSAPRPKDFEPYRQQFRDIASALRSRMSLTDYKKHYE
jgi:hypothetical protein